jgi:hypothetical protein
MTDHSAAAEGIAGAVLLAITLLGLIGRRKTVAATTVTYTADGVQRTFQPGAVIPDADIKACLVPAEGHKRVYLPFLRLLVIGKDNRTSTSKIVALAWTYAIFFGLLALIVANWLGSSAGYHELIKNGLRDEYLLFLGGPYAAAVIAKYKAQTSTDKTTAGVGSASPKQLITDDSGDVDLGDFQYVLFNALALAFYLGTFIPHLQQGMPRLPSLLTGLALTSAGGYTAKQLVSQAAPQLLSLLPTSVPRGSAVEVWGNNLIVSANTAPDGSPVPPAVVVGGAMTPVTASEQTLGADHVTVEVPPNATPGQTKLRVVRADGVPALGPAGTDSLPITIT